MGRWSGPGRAFWNSGGPGRAGPGRVFSKCDGLGPGQAVKLRKCDGLGRAATQHPEI